MKSSRFGVGSLICVRVSYDLRTVSGDLRHCFALVHKTAIMDSVKYSENEPSKKESICEFGIPDATMDKEATFDFAFREYYSALCFFARSIVIIEEDAKDIVQECFIKFWNQKKIDNPELLRSHLFLSVRNRCIDHLRRKKIKKRIEGELTIEEASQGTEYFDELVFAELVRQVIEHIEQLPEHNRKIIRMHFSEGKTYKAIARQLNSSAEAVRKQQSRSLEIIRAKLLPPLAVFSFFLKIFMSAF